METYYRLNTLSNFRVVRTIGTLLWLLNVEFSVLHRFELNFRALSGCFPLFGQLPSNGFTISKSKVLFNFSKPITLFIAVI